MKKPPSDIIIDAGQTRIKIRQSQPVTRGGPPAPRRARTDAEKATPRWTRKQALYFGGFMLLAAALLAIPISTMGGPFWYLVVIAAMAGVYPLLLVATNHHSLSKPTQPKKKQDEVSKTRATRIAALLSSESGPVTVEDIAKKLAWMEPAVVDGLKHLLDNGRVEEDLDLDSGLFIYRLSLDEELESISKSALSLEERFARELPDQEAEESVTAPASERRHK